MSSPEVFDKFMSMVRDKEPFYAPNNVTNDPRYPAGTVAKTEQGLGKKNYTVIRTTPNHTLSEEMSLLRELGFLDKKIDWRDDDRYLVRTILGQISFLIWASTRGAAVDKPLEFRQHSILLPFFEGSTLLSLLAEGDSNQATTLAFNDILVSHAKGIVFGMRSPQNIVISPDGTALRHLAYDIQLEGEFAEEMEVAQFLAETIMKAHFNEAIMNQLKLVLDTQPILKRYDKKQDLHKIKELTQKYCQSKSTETDLFTSHISPVITWLFEKSIA